jgi:cytoskeletal protein CcmA (bactofilin family)
VSAAATPPPGIPPAPPARPRDVVDRGIVRRDGVRADRWRLRGTAKILGPIDVGRAEIDGALVATGTLTAERIRVRGSLDVEGAVEVAGALATDGNFSARSTVRIGEGNLHGTTRLSAGIVATGSLAVRGSLLTPDVTAGDLRLAGTATVPGLCRATRVSAKFDGSSQFGAVEAREVHLRGHRTNVVDRALLRWAAVTVQRIEADAVVLEAVDVEFVRAPSIVLGPESHVTRVEGTVVRAHPTSRQGPESRSPPPDGLRR